MSTLFETLPPTDESEFSIYRRADAAIPSIVESLDRYDHLFPNSPAHTRFEEVLREVGSSKVADEELVCTLVKIPHGYRRAFSWGPKFIDDVNQKTVFAGLPKDVVTQLILENRVWPLRASMESIAKCIEPGVLAREQVGSLAYTIFGMPVTNARGMAPKEFDGSLVFATRSDRPGRPAAIKHAYAMMLRHIYATRF